MPRGCGYMADQFSRLVLIALTHGVAIRDLSVASGAMAFVAAVSMLPLSFFEHSRSPRPSAIRCSFLFLATLFDIVQTRTAWMSAVQWPQSTDPRLLIACVVLKAVPLLLLESRHKTRWIRWDDKDTGIVLNLFSQDTTIIDVELPLAYLNVILAIAAAVGMAIVSALGSPYLAISYPFLMALLWFIQKFYLRTSRQLRLLDLEAKSPL
jgi:hypothetical protein